MARRSGRRSGRSRDGIRAAASAAPTAPRRPIADPAASRRTTGPRALAHPSTAASAPTSAGVPYGRVISPGISVNAASASARSSTETRGSPHERSRAAITASPNSAVVAGAAQVDGRRLASARSIAAVEPARLLRPIEPEGEHERRRAQHPGRVGHPAARRCRAPSRAPARRCPGPQSPRLAEPASPSPPVTAAASSERMSPNMFSVTITSKRSGACTSCIAALSTSMWSSVDVRIVGPRPRRRPAATSARSRARSPCRPRSRCRRRARASSNARRTIRSTWLGWYSHVSKTVPSSRTPFAPK